MRRHQVGTQGVIVDGHFFNCAEEVLRVGAVIGAAVSRADGDGRIARGGGESAVCSDGGRRGHAVHVEIHRAGSFIADSDHVMPVAIGSRRGLRMDPCSGGIMCVKPESCAGCVDINAESVGSSRALVNQRRSVCAGEGLGSRAVAPELD